MLAARDTRYDQIHIGFTDTLSASVVQGFALSENNLHRLEAFHAYYDHLAPGGILSISRFPKVVGDEALRVLVLTLATPEERGIEDPRRHRPLDGTRERSWLSHGTADRGGSRLRTVHRKVP